MAINRPTFTQPSLIAATAGLTVALSLLAVTRPPVTDHPPAPAPVVDLQEDDPGWDCNVHGNGSCDPMPAAAWHAWDASRNALELGDQITSIEFVGPSDVHIPGHMLVDGYLFRIIYPTI